MSAADQVLALQRSVGNRATGQRLLQRAPSGLRASGPTATFSADALSYWKDPANKQEPVTKYVEHLSQKANVALKALDVYPMLGPAFDTSIPWPGQFDARTWTVTLNTTRFSVRPGVTITKVSDLNPDEAAQVASSVYHEARHAEQQFRIGRMVAGASKQQGTALAEEVKKATLIFADAAKAAAALPLPAAGNAALLAEAKDWQAMTTGAHAEYKNVVNTWMTEVEQVIAVPYDPLTGDKARERIGQFLTSWRGPKRLGFVKGHLKALNAKKPKTHVDRDVLTRLYAIAKAMDTVDKGWADFKKQDRPKKMLDRFQAFKKNELSALGTVLHAAYRAQAHEADAAAAGEAVAKQFKAAGTPPAPAKPATVRKPPAKAGVP